MAACSPSMPLAWSPLIPTVISEDLAVGDTRDTTLTYQISDGNGGTDTATITVTVSGVNDAPVATDDAFTGVTENDSSAVIGNALTADNGSGIDSDPDGDTLTVTAQTGVAGSNGGLFSIDAAGVVTFDPNGNFEDLAVGATRDTTLTYQISDGNGGTDTATITVTVSGVNDAPVATDDAFTGVTENDSSAVIGNALTADNGSGIDSDPDGDTLTVTAQTGVAGSNGGLFSIDAAGVVTFDPNGNSKTSPLVTHATPRSPIRFRWQRRHRYRNHYRHRLRRQRCTCRHR